MRYFLDQEFIEDGRQLTLISIGIVAEDGRELYLVSSEFEDSQCDDWVKVNVLPHLGDGSRFTREKIRLAIEEFLIKDKSPEFWGYFADYDWVCFCRLWGRMLDLPEHFPKYCMDLKQLHRHLRGLLNSVGASKPLKNYVAQSGTEHNALEDARWNRDVFKFLQSYATHAGIAL